MGPRYLAMKGFETQYPELQIISFFIIVFCSFFIYFKTKELYDLTEHKGIGFFRKAFLFFGISFFIGFFGFIFKNFLRGLEFDHRYLVFFLILSNLIGVFYLFASLYSKKIKSEWKYLLTIFGIVALSLFTANPRYLIFTQLVLFLILAVISYGKLYSNKNKKRFSQIYIIYMLLFLFWITQTIGHRGLINFGYGREISSVLGAIIFMYITFRVTKRLVK